MLETASLRYIPQELKMNALWCVWKYVRVLDKTTGKPAVDANGEVKMSKIPFCPTDGSPAKSNDPKTFSSYPTMLKALPQYLSMSEDGRMLGGSALGIFKGYSAIDIDHCVEDGELSEMARDIVEYCQSYTEYSPSKTGIRIIFRSSEKIEKGKYYINNHKLGLEIYISDDTNKFVTITGNRISDVYSDVADVDIRYILDKYMVRDAKALDFDRALEKDAKLRALWYGEHRGNESSDDMALCCKLAYYAKGDPREIERLMRASPYFASKDDAHKAKWNRADYVTATIDNAIKLTSNAVSAYQPQAVSTATGRKYDLNDTGNARRFSDRFGPDVRYNYDNARWMIWNGTYWQTDMREYVKVLAEVMAEEMMSEAWSENDEVKRNRLLHNVNRIYNAGGKEALLREAQHLEGVPVFNDELDKDPRLLCCLNGVLDMSTMSFKDPDKADLISMCAGCEADLEGEPTTFIKTINDMFEGDQEVIHYLQKAFGYSCSNDTREQCMFILYGDGNNGKSMLLDVIKEALGGYAITSRPQLLTEQRNGNSNLEEIARLKGKRFIVVEEAKAGDKLDESLVKSMTSGIGNQVARFLYANSFEFPVTGKIWMATNYKPVIRGTDKGIWRRIKIIPLHVDFEGREDRDLKSKLLKELPQILGWLLKGYKMYLEEGLREPECVKGAIKGYREEMDIVAKWISECCEVRADYYEQAGALFANFNAFCKQGKEFEMSQTLFGRNLGKKFEKRTYGGRAVYLGIRIRKGAQSLDKQVAFDSISVGGDI